MFYELSKYVTGSIEGKEYEVNIDDLEKGFYYVVVDGGYELELPKLDVDKIIDNWYTELEEQKVGYYEQYEHERQERHGWEQV